MLSNGIYLPGIVYTTAIFLLICSFSVVAHESSSGALKINGRYTYGKTFAPLHEKYTIRENVTTELNTPQYRSGNKKIRNLLQINGFKVGDKGNNGLMVRVGDIIYFPEDVIPQIKNIQKHRSSNLLNKYLWLDKNGNAEVMYFMDKGNKTSPERVENGMKGWADNTCITFTKLEPRFCHEDLGHAVVCMTAEGGEGCASSVGNVYEKYKSPQKLYLDEICSDFASAHEIGHTLGLAHEQTRSDSREFMFIKPEHFYKEPSANRYTLNWARAGICSPDQVIQNPAKPFDPSSCLMYSSRQMSNSELLSIIAKDVHIQYLSDYREYADDTLPIQTHLDYYIINMGYKCTSKWSKRCQENGKTVPKCTNFGYLTKKCVCACATGFSGSTCSKKTGPMFPLMKKSLMLDVNEPGMLDLQGKGMIDETTWPCREMRYITIVIRCDDNYRISATVGQPFDRIAEVYTRKQDFFMKKDDCFVIAHMGDFAQARVRSECAVSLINNEFPENRLVLRSRNRAMDIYIHTYPDVSPEGTAKVAREAVEFQFDINFLECPELTMEVNQKDRGPIIASLIKFGKAMKATAKKYALMFTLIPIFVILIAAVAFGVFQCNKKLDRLDNMEKASYSSASTGSDSSTSS